MPKHARDKLVIIETERQTYNINIGEIRKFTKGDIITNKYNPEIEDYLIDIVYRENFPIVHSMQIKCSDEEERSSIMEQLKICL